LKLFESWLNSDGCWLDLREIYWLNGPWVYLYFEDILSSG
jgi:hypothetical protein